MARLEYKGQVIEVSDSDVALLDYYRGDGAVDVSAERVQVEQLPGGEAFQDDGTEKAFEPGQPVPDATGQVVDTETGQPVDGAEAPRPGPDAAPAA